jgi:hypothetical protein
MLFRISSLMNLPVHARDGEIGSVSDLLFEDDTWRARWLVVDTGSWILGRKVLLPASHVKPPEQGASSITVDLTRQQVEESPGTGVDLPVSRQMETSLYDHYGWAPYWGVAGTMGYVPPIAYTSAPYPAAGVVAPSVAPGTAPELEGGDAAAEEPKGDPHLRSADEVMSYYIHARDGDLGHVEDILLQGDEWTIRYFIVDTKNWWPGKMVLVEPDAIESIAWEDRSVHVGRTREQIKSAPEYDPTRPIER